MWLSLDCKDEVHAQHWMEALAAHGKPDTIAFHGTSYELGLSESSSDMGYIVERWNR